MTTFRTGNPVPSTAVRDLYDNAENFDTAVNTTALNWQDRLGRTRKSLAGYDSEVQEAIDRVTGFLYRGEWQPNTDYAPKDVVRYEGMEFITMQAHTSGPNFEADLNAGLWTIYQGIARAELAAPSGSDLVGYQQDGSGSIPRTASEKLSEHLSLLDKGATGDSFSDDTAAMLSAIADGRKVDGLGLVYRVTQLPSDFSIFTRAAFKLGSVLYPTQDYLNSSFAKITNARAYTAWPQDKAYVMNNQIKVWCNMGDAHLDGDIRPAYITTDDGAISYSEVTLLDSQLYKHTCWCAGVAGGFEYAIVRTTDTAPFSNLLYKRPMPSGPLGDYFSSWTVNPITFPVPGWAPGETQPVMIHSFTEGHDGAIYVGGSFGAGACVYKSSDGGATWQYVIDLGTTTDDEEPTIKYANGIYAGFIRGGNNGSNPKFWISRDNLATRTIFTAPAGYFGPTGMQDSCLPLQIVDGVVHAFGSYRNGTLAGLADDAVTPMFYIRANLAQGDNIWAYADTFQIGTGQHQELGGASANGQGSVVHFRDKIILYFGSEDRTGRTLPINRIANIWQMVIPLKTNAGGMDFRSLMPDDRSANNPSTRTSNGSYIHDIGSVTHRRSNRLSAAYPFVPNTANGLIIDGGSGSSGMTITTDAPYASFYGVTNAKVLTGTRFDLSSGTYQFIINGEILARFDAASKSFRPEADNVTPLGGPTRRWSIGYFGTPPVTTSDARDKTELREFTQSEISAAIELASATGIYQWLDMVDKKGSESARMHVGTTVQLAMKIMEKHKLDPTRYGFICHDVWEDQYETTEDEEGNRTKKLVTPAGDKYGFRMDQLNSFINRGLVARQNDLDARLKKLEA